MSTASVSISAAARVAATPGDGRALYFGLWVLLVLLTAMFLGHAADSVRLVVGAGFVPGGVALALRDRVRAVALIPALALLGPIARVPLGAVELNLGDLYLGSLVLAALVGGDATRPLRLGPYAGWLFTGFALALTSALLSIDRSAAIYGIVGIVEVGVVYFLTLDVVRDSAATALVLRALAGAVGLSCVLVLVSFSRGEALLLNTDPQLLASLQANALTNSETYVAATFFVTGFVFPLAAVSVIAAVLVGQGGLRAPERALYVFMIFIGLLTQLLMDAKTALVATIAVLGLVLVRMIVQPRTRARAIALALGASVLGALAVWRVQSLLPEAQLVALYGRLSSAESMRMRLILWRNVFSYLADSPRTVLIGLGPEASVRAGGLPLFRRLFYSVTQEGAVDSSYMYLVLNYGVPVLLLVVAVAGVTLLNLGRTLRRRGGELGLAVWGALAVWLVMGLSQQSAMAKPMFIFGELLALAHALSLRASVPRAAVATAAHES